MTRMDDFLQTVSYSPDLVTICAWCPDAAARTAAAHAQGSEVTHGICSTCRKKLESSR